MIVPFDDFLPEVLQDVKGCPDIVAVNAIRNAAIEFCERGNFWKVDLDAMTTEAGVAAYDLDSPVNSARIIQVMALFCDGNEIHPRTEEWLDAHEAGWRTDQRMPKFFFQQNPDIIKFAHTPDAPYSITGTVSLCPKRKSTGIEQFILENHIETIASGAKARLLGMRDTQWSNPQLSMVHDKKFNSGITLASVSSAKGYVRAPIRTKPFF